MLLAVAVLLGQFIPQQGCFVNTSYVVNNNHGEVKTCEYNQNKENIDESNEDETILISSKDNNGKFLNASAKKEISDKDGEDSEDTENDLDTPIIDNEAADAHLQQLAYSIADDLGIVTKVSVNR